jgi:HCOMODA/2-hydroxy-3-carboxy-muconic semialdehyde decarboxylase
MSVTSAAIEDLVRANRILSREGVVDAFGHVSIRHPEHSDRFLLSRARSPELVEPDDIMTFGLDGEPVEAGGAKPYLERFIHAAIYAARPDLQSVVHSHSPSIIPFGVTTEVLRPIMHSCAAIGPAVPVWDAEDRFGATNLLVADIEMGRDMARVMGQGPSVLMRGHGSTVGGRSLREAVYTAVYLEVNASLQMRALQLGTPKFLSEGEIAQVRSRADDPAGKPGEGFNRAWDYWCRRAGVAG